MKLALSSWSLHTLFLNGLLTPESFPGLASQGFGVRAVEYFEGDFCDDVLSVTAKQVATVVEACGKAGVTICSISARNDLATADENAASQDVVRLHRWLDIAADLGCRVLRINTGLARPSVESLRRAAKRLRPLLDPARKCGVTLAVENHPHVIRHAADLDLILEFVAQLKEEGLRTCPDTGAFAADFRREGFRRMAREAAHVHLKAPDFSPGCASEAESYRGYIDDLKALEYEQYVSIEYLELLNPNRDPLIGSWEAIRSVGEALQVSVAPTSPTNRRALAMAPYSGPTARIPGGSAKIAESVLPLILEGCEAKLGAPTRLHPFCTQGELSSFSCAHKDTEAESGLTSPRAFCGLVQQDPDAETQCRRFYNEQFDRIRAEGGLMRPVGFCPMGLALMFIPVRTEREMYGAIACGAWRESGTEGVILYGVDRCVKSEEVKAQLEGAIVDIPQLTASGLANARETLHGAARDLAIFYRLAYENESVLKQDALIQAIIDSMRGEEFRSLESAASRLGSVLQMLDPVLAHGYAAVYLGRRFAGDTEEIEFSRAASHPTHNVPSELALSGTVIKDPQAFPLGNALLQLRSKLQDLGLCFIHDLGEERLALILFGGPDIESLRDRQAFLSRTAREIAYTLGVACVLDKSASEKEKLTLFADETRHELNGPLQGIRSAVGRLRGLLKSDGTSGQIDGAAQRADAFADEAAMIVDKLSRASIAGQLQQRRDKYSFSRAQLGPIIRQASKPFRLAANERGIEIRIDPSVYDLPPLDCDRQKMQILFANLIDNAVKFSHRNRPVVIRASSEFRSVGTDKSARHLAQIVVSDFGLGVPDADLADKIFRPYFQSSVNDPKRSIGGTGLGLFVCKEIVDRHGGQISASCTLPRSKQIRRALTSQEELLQGCQVEIAVVLPVSRAED